LGAKVMEMELNYLASKKWEKVGRQELRSTPYEQELTNVLFFNLCDCELSLKFKFILGSQREVAQPTFGLLCKFLFLLFQVVLIKFISP
jgi:hypothetical protein